MTTPITMKPATAAVLEDIDWMLSNGESAEMAAIRVGRSLTSLTRLCRRHGRPDLGRAFDAARQATETHRCQTCTAQVSRESVRCWTCYLATR